MSYGSFFQPSFRGASADEEWQAALDMPLSTASTFWESTKAGVLESFGAGTAIRELSLPDEAPTKPEMMLEPAEGGEPVLVPDTPQMRRRMAVAPESTLRPETDVELGARREKVGALDQDAYKNSPYFREDIPWDAGMTEERAAALATMYDVKKVREYYGQKRPITAFLGNLAGQAIDPINYIPIAGPAVRAANVARFGRVAGEAATASLDAALNTGIFGLATRDTRRSFGDDVSWQTTVSEIATAALIGGAFGSVAGVLGRRADAKAKVELETKLATLKNTQEARIALNEAIGGLVNDGEVRLSPNAAGPIERVAREVSAQSYQLRAVDPGEEAIPSGQIERVASSVGPAGKLPARPRSLLDFLAGEGGIKDDAGDLAAIGVTRKFIPGRGTLIRKSGMELDKAREAAAQAGYFDHIYGTADEAAEKSTVRDLLDLIDQESRGTPAYSMQEQARVQAVQDYEAAIANRDDYKEFVADLAKTLNDMEIGVAVDDAILARATDIMIQEKLSPLDAFDRAVLEDEARFEASLAERGISYRGNEKFADIPFFDEPSGLDASARGIAGRAEQNGLAGGRAGNEAYRGQSAGLGANARAAVDLSAARPDPIPEGRRQAEATIAKPDDYKALAAQYRVDPESGAYLEEGEVRQLQDEGRLSAEDIGELDAGQQTFENGVSWGEALKAAVNCLI